MNVRENLGVLVDKFVNILGDVSLREVVPRVLDLLLPPVFALGDEDGLPLHGVLVLVADELDPDPPLLDGLDDTLVHQVIQRPPLYKILT